MEDEEHFIDSTRVKRSGPSVCCIVAAILGVVVAVSVATNIGLSVGIYKVKSDKNPVNPNPSNDTNVTACDTPECVELGAQILASLDEAFHPCEDFYQFACKKSLNQAIIPYGSQTTGAFDKLASLQQERFRVELSKPVNTSVEAVGKAMTYYHSCVNTSTGPDPRAHASLIQLLADLGGWPLVGIGESNQTYDINDEGGFLTEILYGSNAFFGFSISANPDNATNNILTVDQGGLTVPIELVYTNATLRKALKDNMVTLLKDINPNIDNSVYEAAVDDIISFEAEIAGITDFKAMKLPFYKKINVTAFESLVRWMPEFHWLQNFEYYGRVGGTPIEVTNSTPIDVYGPSSFFTGLNALIANTSATTLQNYAKWHLVSHLLPIVSQASAKAYHSINNLMTGIEYDAAVPAYSSCISSLEHAMPYAMARVLIEAYPPNGVAENISVVITGLRAALKERISEKEWLDDSTKNRALNKVDKIMDFLVYPEFIFDNTKLNKIYASLNVSATASYFENYLNLTKYTHLNHIVRLAHIISRKEWNPDIIPTETNAKYSPFGNQIYILYGILNTPFFKPYWPDYFKFSTIGLVVGHELVHGFDNSGRRFDEEGNFVNWWSEKALNEFNTRAQCFVNQYNQYSLPAGPVNGTQTLGENIADNGGLATAYRAYKNMKGEGKMLPGLKYTPDQLFFIGSAQPWCQVATLPAQQQLLQDAHTPASLRPLGFLSNSPEFAAAFNCPSGSRMNPTHKCEIW